MASLLDTLRDILPPNPLDGPPLPSGLGISWHGTKETTVKPLAVDDYLQRISAGSGGTIWRVTKIRSGKYTLESVSLGDKPGHTIVVNSEEAHKLYKRIRYP